MSEKMKYHLSSDEMLVAFLDGQLPPADQQAVADLVEKDEILAQRLAFLGSGRLPFRDAFDPLLDKAPTQRMAEKFAHTAVRRDQALPFTRRRFIAVVVTLVAAGAAADRGFDALTGARQRSKNDGWREVVANYMELYSTRTLENLANDSAMLDAQVAGVGQNVGLALKHANVEVPGLSFKRAQTLQFEGKPLAQFAFLDSDGQPLAFCVLAHSDGETSPQLEERHGMTVVYWSSTTHSFLVIGHVSAAAVKKIAGEFRQALPT